MEIIHGGRQSGKTHLCIEYLEDHSNAVMICHTEHEAGRLRKEHPPLAERIVGPRQVTSGNYYFFRDKKVIIDQLDLLIEYLLHAQVTFSTVTAQPFPINDTPLYTL